MSGPDRPQRQGLLQGVVLTLAAEGIALPAGLLTAIVLTRSLGPGEYGRFTVVASTVAITEWLLIAVLARAVVKFVAEADDWRPVAHTALRLYAGAGLFVATVFWILAPTIATALGDPELSELFRLFSPQMAVFAVGAGCRNVLAGRARFREQAVTSAVSWLGRVAFIVTLVSLGWGVRGAVAGSLCGTIGGTIAAIALARIPLRVNGTFPARQLLQLAAPAFVAMLASRLQDQIGLLALQVLAIDPAEVGYYGAAMNVMLLTGVLAAAVGPVLISSVSAARRSSDEAATARIALGTVRFSIALLPFAFILVGSADDAVDLLFGPQFAAAAPLMAWLIVAAVARAATANMASLFIALGFAWTAAVLALPLPVLALAGYAAAIPAMGAAGAALVSGTVALAGASISTLVVGRVARVRLPLGTVVRSAALSLAAWGLSTLVPTAGPLVVLEAVILSAAVIVGFVACGELDRQERDELWNMFRRR